MTAREHHQLHRQLEQLAVEYIKNKIKFNRGEMKYEIRSTYR